MKEVKDEKGSAQFAAHEFRAHLSALDESVARLVSFENNRSTLSVSFEDFRGIARARDSGPGLELERVRDVEVGTPSVADPDKSDIAIGRVENCFDGEADVFEPSIAGVPGVNGRFRRRLRERGVRGRPEANEIVGLLRAFASSPSFPVVDTDQREAAAGGTINEVTGMYGGVGVSGIGIGTAEDMTLNSIVAGEFGAENDLLKPGCMRMMFERGWVSSSCGKI